MSASYHRAEAQALGEALSFDIDGEVFTVRPRLGFRAIAALRRARDDPMAVVDLWRAMLATEDDFERLVALDLNDQEMADVMQMAMGLYGDAGKSQGSPSDSPSAGASSMPTSNGSTALTLPPSGLAAASAPAVSAT